MTPTEKRPVYPIHPGTVLADELAELGMSPAELARELHVPSNRLYQLLTARNPFPACGSGRRVIRDMARPGLSREKVLATIIRLMDLTFIRVGNEEYAKENGSFGLTTLQDKHAKVEKGRIHFMFRGKSGKNHTIQVEDRHLAKIVKHCQDIPGQDLFQFFDAKGQRRDVTSGDVNDYLRQIAGADFTAKDFRTWAGTVLTAQALKTARWRSSAQTIQHAR